MVHCELPNTPKAPSNACSCWCSTLTVYWQDWLVLSGQTQTPSLSLRHRFCSCKKGLSLLTKSFVATHICSERRSKQFLLIYYAAFRVTASVSFSPTYVEIWTGSDRLDGTWCLLSCRSSAENETQCYCDSLCPRSNFLPAYWSVTTECRPLGMNALPSWPKPWGFPGQGLRKTHAFKISVCIQFLGFWAKPKVHILPDSAAQANESGSVGCQGQVQESFHITPGRSDMSSHFVFLPWQWLKKLQQSCFTPYEACSLLYYSTQPVQHEGKSVLASICEMCPCQERLKNWLVLLFKANAIFFTKGFEERNAGNSRDAFEHLALDGVANLTAVRLRSCFNRMLYDAWEAACQSGWHTMGGGLGGASSCPSR